MSRDDRLCAPASQLPQRVVHPGSRVAGAGTPPNPATNPAAVGLRSRYAPAALSPPGRHPRGLSRVRRRTAAGAAAFGDALAQGVGALGRAAVGPLPGRPARPAAARGLRGPTRAPVHAGLVRRGVGRLRRGGARTTTAHRRARRRRGDPAAGGRDRTHTTQPAGADGKPAARPTRARAGAGGLAGGDDGGRDPRPRPPRSPTARAPRSAPSAAYDCRRAATPPRAICSATRSPTCPATPAWRARGRSARGRGRARARATCSSSIRGWTCRCCCCGPTRTSCTRSRPPKRRCGRSPTASCGCCQSTGFLMAYDDPVGLARELVAFCG